MIRNYNADCLSVFPILKDGCIDLTITSPPYDNLRTYQGSLKWNHEIFKDIARQLFRITKPGGVIVWVVNDSTVKGSETGSSFKQALYFKEIGFNLHDTMIYMKDSSPFPDKSRYYSIFEYMFILSKGKPARVNLIKDRKNKWFGLKKLRGSEYDKRGNKVRHYKSKEYEMKEYGVRHNVWKINTGFGKSTKDKIDHPAIFPEKLAADHISSWSNENDLVLDPFMGSGTVGKMCKLMNRKFIGIEKEEKYFDIARCRIKNA